MANNSNGSIDETLDLELRLPVASEDRAITDTDSGSMEDLIEPESPPYSPVDDLTSRISNHHPHIGMGTGYVYQLGKLGRRILLGGLGTGPGAWVAHCVLVTLIWTAAGMRILEIRA